MPTIEEQIEKYIKQHPINVNQKFISAEIIAEIQHDAFLAVAGATQQWISSEDESPKKGDRVLLKDKDGEIECLLIYNEDYVTVLMERFTHWRYLDFLI